MGTVLIRSLMGLSIGVFILLIVMPLLALLYNIGLNLNVSINYQDILGPLILSIITSLISTIISFFIGIPLAYLLTYKELPFKEVFDIIINLPLVIPPTVAGYLLLITFGKYGLIGYPLHLLGITIMFSTFAIILAQTFVALPFMVRSVKTSFEDIPPSLIDASKTLGAGEYEIFKEIILPLSKPGIISGIILTYARAIGEFGATMMVSGLLSTLPIAIFNSAQSGNREVANILSLILILISFGILALFKRIGYGKLKKN